MLSKILGIFKSSKKDKKEDDCTPGNRLKEFNVFSSLDKNIEFLKSILSKSEDIVYRQIETNENRYALVYISGLVDRNLIENQILKPLMDLRLQSLLTDLSDLMDNLITVSDISKESNFFNLINNLLSGETLLFCDGISDALVVNSKGGEKRGIEEPFSEQGVRSPRESFTENIEDNITLIRRRIKDTNLVVKFYSLGERTQTKTALIYLADNAPEHVITEVQERIKSVNVEGLVASANLEQIIENHKWSIFPQIMSTELPDRVVKCILDGRVAIVVEGSPYNLVVPGTLAMFFNSGDDYYERTIPASLIRISRYISFFFATTLPAIYSALTAYHPGMLPTSLVLYITGTRIGLPLPSVIEMFFMLFTLEILLEAAIRLPKPIAQTVGIVGGLVIGQSAVQAGLVSPLVVIIISFTAISSFTLPYYNFAMVSRSLRVFLLIGASLFGLLGVVVLWILIIIHVASIETFGVRYLQDFFSFKKEKVKDTFLKVPYELLGGKQEALKDEDKK